MSQRSNSSHPDELSGWKKEELTEFVHKAVQQLREPPPLREAATEAEDDRVRLGDRWLPLELVRDTLVRDEAFLHDLVQRGIPLDWLEFPHGRNDPADLPPYQQEVDELLRRRSERATEVSRRMIDAVLSHAEAVPLPEARLPRSEAVEATLGGVAQSIRAKMPRPLRRLGEATFEIERQEHDALGHWQDSTEHLSWRGLFLTQGQLLADMDDATADRLAFQTWLALCDKQDVLPSFHVLEAEPARVRLLWRRTMVSRLAD